METIECPKCGVWWLETPEFWQPRPDKYGGGWYPACRKCRNAQQSAYHKRARMRAKVKDGTARECNKCKEIKTLDHFSPTRPAPVCLECVPDRARRVG